MTDKLKDSPASAPDKDLTGRVEPEVLTSKVTVPRVDMKPNKYTRDREELVKEFERETEEKTMVVLTDGVHQTGIETINYLYVVWLESRLLRQRIKTAALESSLSRAQEREKRLERSVAFYKIRMDALQTFQNGLPEPYRTALCDIIANGSTRVANKQVG